MKTPVMLITAQLILLCGCKTCPHDQAWDRMNRDRVILEYEDKWGAPDIDKYNKAMDNFYKSEDLLLWDRRHFHITH